MRADAPLRPESARARISSRETSTPWYQYGHESGRTAVADLGLEADGQPPRTPVAEPFADRRDPLGWSLGLGRSGSVAKHRAEAVTLAVMFERLGAEA